jgi:SAM-dependent methyltransferase
MSEPKQRLTEFWNAIADGYEGHPGNVVPYGSLEYNEWRDVLRAALTGQASDVLDVGTGTGFLALLAAGLGHRVTGIDLSQQMLTVGRKTAAQRGVSVTFLEGDAVAPPFEPSAFDVVTSRHLLWTLREPGTAMLNWHDLLRPDGRVIIVDGFWSAGMIIDESSDGAEGVFGRYYTPDTLDALPLFRAIDTTPVIAVLSDAGFGQVEARPLPQFTFEGIAPYIAIARR